MRCRHCGYQNESGVYRCQKCGNSLLPPLPKDIYRASPSSAVRRTEQNMRRIVITAGIFALMMAAGGIIAMVMSFTGTSADTAVMEADETTLTPEAGMAMGDSTFEEFMPLQIEEGLLTLPGSDITIGVPEFSNYSSSVNAGTQSVVHTFELEDDLVMEISCLRMDYPFTKSAEEEYFKDEYQYDRLEGQEEQYFIIQSDLSAVTATVVDRLNKTNYTIRMYPADEYEYEEEDYADALEEASRLMNDIVIDQSSLAESTKQ